MKPVFLALAVGLTALAHPVRAEPFDESRSDSFYRWSNPLNKRFMPPGEMAIDDYIIALSKASSVNFIADMTHIPVEEFVPAFPSGSLTNVPSWKEWKASPKPITLETVLDDVSETKRLSRLRYDETTYLLWDSPDALQSARLIIAQGKHLPIDALPKESDLYRALNEYAKSPLLQWEKPLNFFASPSHRTNLHKLPPELRAQLKAFAQYEILLPELRRELVFTDKFWKTALIRLSPVERLGPGGIGKQKSFTINISGQDENGKQLLFLDGYSPTFGYPSGGGANSVYDIPSRRSFKAVPVAATEALQPPAPATQPAPPEAVVLPVLGLTSAQLEAEALLQTKVSLETKRRPLGELLAEVARKNGVEFGIGEGVPTKTALVTAQVNEMPLGTFMGALARVYGVYWTKGDATEYLLHASEKDELQTLLLRSGSGGFRVEDALGQSADERRQQHQELEQQVAAELEGQGAEKPEGVAFSLVPEDLRLRVRQAFEEWVAGQLVFDYRRASKHITDETGMKIFHGQMSSGPSDPRWELVLFLPAPEGQEKFTTALTQTTIYPPPPIPQNEEQPPPGH